MEEQMPRVPTMALLAVLSAASLAPSAQALVAPTLSVTPGAPDGFDGWYAGEPTVKLSASGATGAASLLYCIDGINACVPSTPYTGTFTIREGERYLRYQALDSLGPSSAVISKLFRVDDTPPRVDAIVAPAWGEALPVARVEFRFSEDMDRESTESALDAGPQWATSWTDRGETLVLTATDLAPGTHRLRVDTTARDERGLRLEAARDYYLTVLKPSEGAPAPPPAEPSTPGERPRASPPPAQAELTPPNVRVSVSPSSPTATDRLSVRVDASDASGIAAAWIVVDGARRDVTPGRALTLDPLAVGAHTVQAYATDGARNTGAAEPVVVTVRPAPAPPPDITPEPRPPPDEPDPTTGVRVLVDTDGGPIRGVRGVTDVRVEDAAADNRVRIVLIDEHGIARVLSERGGAIAWDTRELSDGYYVVEAQEVAPSGRVVSASRVEVLVQNARATPFVATAALATGALLAAATTLGAPRGGMRSWVALALGVASLALAFGYARADLALAAAVGAAVLALALATHVALAWSAGVEVRLRPSWSGMLALAATALARLPIGMPAWVEETAPAIRTRETRRADSLRAVGAVAGALVLALPFLILGRAWRYDAGALGVEMALAYAAIAALPFGPLPGAAVWRWNRLHWTLLAPFALAPWWLHQVGLLPPGALVALGALAGLLVARAAALLGHPAWRHPHGRPGGLAGPGPLRAHDAPGET